MLVKQTKGFKIMSVLQTQIEQATTTEQLKTVLENAEPRQENGFQTSFVRHLLNTFWYFPFGDQQFENQKRFALNLCKQYNK